MSYGARVIFYFVVISVIWFFALNIISVTYYKNALEAMTAEQAALYLKLEASGCASALPGRAAALPGHLVASDHPLADKSLILLPGASASTNLYVRRSYLEERLKSFALVLFGVEASLFLSLMFFTYVVVGKFVRDKDSGEKFLNLILLSFNHKIGNFLAAQKLNVEILRDRVVSVSMDEGAERRDAAGGDIRVIERLCANCQNMEADVVRTLRMIRAHDSRVKFSEKTDLMEAMKNTLELFSEDFSGEKRLTAAMESIIIKADPNDVENVFYNLVSNAVKYSSGSVHIRMSRYRGNARVFIRNDFLAGEPASGAGLGIEITKSIAAKNGWKIAARKKYGYIVYIKFK